MDSKPVIVEEIFHASADKVWKAITDKEEMKKWYFEVDAFEPVAGFIFRFAGKGHKGENYVHICKITEVATEQKLQYSWQYENYPGSSLVTFELTDEHGRTRIRLKHEGLETFPPGNPDFARESFMSGWMYIITQLLRDYLAAVSK